MLESVYIYLDIKSPAMLPVGSFVVLQRIVTKLYIFLDGHFSSVSTIDKQIV